MTRQDMTQTQAPALGSVEWYAAGLVEMSDEDLLAIARRGLVRNYRTAVNRALRARGLEVTR